MKMIVNWRITFYSSAQRKWRAQENETTVRWNNEKCYALYMAVKLTQSFVCSLKVYTEYTNMRGFEIKIFKVTMYTFL